MPLSRKPDFATPRTQDRAVKGAFDAIRQRINAAELLINSIELQSSKTSTAGTRTDALLKSLQQQITILKNTIAGITVAGQTTVFTADTNLAVGDAVYGSSTNGVSLVDPTDPFAIYAATGVAETAAAAGTPVTVRTIGVTTTSETTLIAGLAVYADVGGGLTQDPMAAVIVPVGVAVNNAQVFVAPSWPILAIEGFDTDHEDALPVSFGLLKERQREPIVRVFADTLIEPTTRLVIVDAGADDVLLTLPSGLYVFGDGTHELTLYRRDSASGLGGNIVTIVAQSGETIDGIYETELFDRLNRSFLAVGAEGWIETT